MAHVEIVVEQPDVCFDADTAGLQRREERHLSPVVIVRMTADGDDVPGNVRGPMRDVVMEVAGASSPSVGGPFEFVREE